MRLAFLALPLLAALPAQAQQAPMAAVPMQVSPGAVVPQDVPLVFAPNALWVGVPVPRPLPAESAPQGRADRCMGLAWRLSGSLAGRTPAEADRLLRDEAVAYVYREPGTRNAYPAEGTLIVGLDASGRVDRLGCAGWITVRSQP
jgi:hypothetical protein